MSAWWHEDTDRVVHSYRCGMPEANFNRFAKAAACVLKVLNEASPDDALANSRTSNRELRLIGRPAARYRGRAGLLVIRHLERG